MKPQRRSGRRGSSMVEFSLAAVPILFSLIFTVELGRAMWIYHTLAYNVKNATRLASVRGSNCASPNSCRITLATLASQLSGVGIDPASVNVTLTPAAGVSCAPLSNCVSSTTLWPPDGANAPGSSVEISATYNFVSAFGNYALNARSRQMIQF